MTLLKPAGAPHAALIRLLICGAGVFAEGCSLRSLDYLVSERNDASSDASTEDARNDGMNDASSDARTEDARNDGMTDASAPPTYVQTCGADNYSKGCPTACPNYTTASCSFTQGNVLAVFIKWYTSTDLGTVSAACVAGGFTILRNPTPDEGVHTAGAALAYGVVTSSGPCSITASAPSDSEIFLVIDEIANINTTNPLDDNQSALSATPFLSLGTSLSSGSLMTTLGGDYIYVVVADDEYHSTYVTGSGFIGRGSFLDYTSAATESQIQASAGAIDGFFTSDKTGYFLVGAMAFRAR